jgi:uncharacterized protein (DUF433 family)
LAFEDHGAPRSRSPGAFAGLHLNMMPVGHNAEGISARTPQESRHHFEELRAKRGGTSLSILAEALTGRWLLNYSAAVDYSKIITIEPGKRSGKPCIRGMRITVQDVFEYLAGGMTEDQILEDFPELTREDINACFAFAADRERKLFVAPA